MTGRYFTPAILAGAVLLVSASVLAVQPVETSSSLDSTQDLSQEHSRLQQQQSRDGNSAQDPGKGAKGNHGQETRQDAAPDVRQGPYGDKQNAKKSGSGGGK